MPTTISNQLLENPTRKWSFKNATSQRTLQHLPTGAVLQRMVADYRECLDFYILRVTISSCQIHFTLLQWANSIKGLKNLLGVEKKKFHKKG